jgi:hypothetical protein
MKEIARLGFLWAFVAMLLLPSVASAQLVLLTNGNAIVVIGYTGSPSAVVIPGTTNGLLVTSIAGHAFYDCTSLTRITIGNGVASIGNYAFYACTNLTGVYFQGNAPSLGGAFVFTNDNTATVYHLPGTTGWGTSFGGRPARLWDPQVQRDANFGVRTNCFGFTITNAGNPAVVVEACTNLANPAWSPLQTNALIGGSSYFGDADWTNYPCRFYGFRMP